MKHSLTINATVIVILLLTSNVALAKEQPSPEERAYKFRTSLFQTFAWKLGQMAGAKGQDDSAAFTKHAADLVTLSGLIEEGFAIEGSLPEGTKAKSEIWEDYAKFQDRAANLTTLAGDYTNADAMADFDPRDFGSKACGSCHRDFKIKD